MILDKRTWMLFFDDIRLNRNPHGKRWGIEVEVVRDNTECNHEPELTPEQVADIRKQKGMSNYMASIYDIDPDWGCTECPLVVDLTKWHWRNNKWQNPKEIYSGTSLIADGAVDRELFDKKIEPYLIRVGLDPTDYV